MHHQALTHWNDFLCPKSHPTNSALAIAVDKAELPHNLDSADSTHSILTLLTLLTLSWPCSLYAPHFSVVKREVLPPIPLALCWRNHTTVNISPFLLSNASYICVRDRLVGTTCDGIELSGLLFFDLTQLLFAPPSPSSLKPFLPADKRFWIKCNIILATWLLLHMNSTQVFFLNLSPT